MVVVEAPVLGAAGVQVMGAGVIAHAITVLVRGDPHHAGVYHLAEVVATAGHLLTAVLAVILLMPMEIKVLERGC